MPTPSLLIVPSRWKTGNPGKLYSQIPTNGNGDFNVTGVITGATNAGTRVNNLGYIEPITTSGTPRLDYYTSSGLPGCPALLVEPSATNSILQSADSASGWTLNASMTRATIDVIGVSGVNLTVGASGSIGSAGSRYTSPIISPALNLASGSTYTISFLAKKTTAHTILGYYVTIAGAAAGDLGGGFDVSGSFNSGSIYNSAGTTNRIRRVEQWGTDVFRCSETFTMTASGTVERINLGVLTAVNSTTAAPIGTTIGFAAPQLELGSVPTSFIPTTTGSVTRNADVISVTGVAGLIGQTEGTIYLDLTVLSKGSSANRWLQIFGASNNIGLAINSSNQFRSIINAQSDTLLTAPLISSGVKVAWAYDGTGTTCFINGTQYTLTNGGNQTMSSLTSLTISGSDNAQLANARIRAVALYTTRLSNDQLAALTTL